MQTIISVMSRSYMSFVYITALMFLFIMIFTLLGMQTFAGYWKDDPEGTPPNNYDTFGYAFFTIFQVLTMENWQTVMFVSMRNNETLIQNIRAPGILMLWIFIGNFILLNLFLAILLDAFLEDGEPLSEEEIEFLR
jgi:magnesium-transporting ATPase (P-type)